VPRARSAKRDWRKVRLLSQAAGPPIQELRARCLLTAPQPCWASAARPESPPRPLT